MRLLFEILFCIFLIGCASSYQVIGVIDLPPPQQVQAERRSDQIIVRWRPGLERRQPHFSGYKLFMAPHSLATTPAQELPPPIALPDNATTFSLAAGDATRLFLHIRSCVGKRKVSLPSLPEVIVPEKTIPQQ
jgi:hypothetical protein